MNLSSLIFCGCRDWDSLRLEYMLDVKTKTHRDWEISWMSRPRLIETEKFLGCRDRDSLRLRNFLDVETETHRDWKILWMSRLRLIKTEKFLGCRDQDSSRLGNLMDVETETSRDWAKHVDTETPSRLLLISEDNIKITFFLRCQGQRRQKPRGYLR